MQYFDILNQKFRGKKTYITAIATVLIAVGTFLMGEITLFDGLQLIIPAILGATVRHGITTEATKAVESTED